MENQILCGCGCKGVVKTLGCKFLRGHYRKKSPVPLKLCECGCGEYAALGMRFKHNHHWNLKEFRQQAAETTKEQLRNQDPEVSKRVIASMLEGSKHRWLRPGEKEVQSKRSKEQWIDPVYREEQCERLRKSALQQWQDPKFCQHIKDLWRDPAKLKKASKDSTKANFERWADPAYRVRVCEAMRNSILRRVETKSKGKNEKAFFESLAGLLEEKIIEGFQVCGFIIDGYLPELNIAIEFDESYHFMPGQQEKDYNRMGIIMDRIGCSFIRVEEKHWLKKKDVVLDFIVESIEEAKKTPMRRISQLLY